MTLKTLYVLDNRQDGRNHFDYCLPLGAALDNTGLKHLITEFSRAGDRQSLASAAGFCGASMGSNYLLGPWPSSPSIGDCYGVTECRWGILYPVFETSGHYSLQVGNPSK